MDQKNSFHDARSPISEDIREKVAAKRVLVTGGAGFLGSAVVKELSHSSAHVTVLDNFSSGKRDHIKNVTETNGITIVEGDICDKEIVRKCSNNQELVIHLAALPFVPDSYYHPQDFFRVNVDGTLNLLLAAAKSDSVERFVYVSSSEVYGSARYEKMDENHPTLPHSTYAASKLAADRVTFTMSKELGLPVVIVRPFNSYGPNITQPYIVPEIIIQATTGNGELSLGNVDAARDLTYSDDTARGIVLSAIAPGAEGEVVNIGTGSAVSIRELAVKITALMNKRCAIKNDPSRLRPYDVDTLVCDNSKAQRLLKWTPVVSLEEGLRRTIQWAKNNSVQFRSPFRNWYRLNKTTPLIRELNLT